MVKITASMLQKSRMAVNEKGLALIKAPCGWIIKPNPSVVFSKPTKIKYVLTAAEKLQMKHARKTREARRSKSQIDKTNEKRRERFASLSHAAKELHREKRRAAHNARKVAMKTAIEKKNAQQNAVVESGLRKKAREARRLKKVFETAKKQEEIEKKHKEYKGLPAKVVKGIAIANAAAKKAKRVAIKKRTVAKAAHAKASKSRQT